MSYIKKGFLGISWLGGSRVFTRIISLASIAILARILQPAQFGIFGIATLVLSFLEIISETGINVFLIQEKQIKQYIDTAWVISIIRGICIFLIILLLSKPLSIFFTTPEVLILLRLISLLPLIKGFINPAILNYQKNLFFNKEVYLRSGLFVISTAVTLIIALLTSSTTSLVWGLIAAAIIETIFSLIFIKPLPKLKLERKQTRLIIHRGKWMTLVGISNYLFHQGDDLIVSKFLGQKTLGFYQMAYKISTLPITEVADIFGRVSFPIYTKISADKKRLRKAFIKTLGTISILVLPLSAIIFFFSSQLIFFVLGPNWLDIVPIIKILAIFGAIRAISGSSSSVLLALKKQREVSNITLISLIGMMVAIFPLMNKFGIMGVAGATLVGSITALPLIIYYVRRELFSNLSQTNKNCL
ncbi:oligosaccharide flippase family protein [Patescibacteria group bacterium]|nr:oligosaccharide flippase family protein [Patescibacteria group bacterium]